MKKRRKQLNASNEVEMDVMVVELSECSTDVVLEGELELDLFENDNDHEIDEFEEQSVVLDSDESEVNNETDYVSEELEDKFDYEFSNDIDLDQLEGEHDVDLNIEDNTDEADTEVEDSKKSAADTDDLEEATFNVEDLFPAISYKVDRIPDAGVLSVINSVKNGKRVVISRDIFNKTGELDNVQMGFFEEGIVIGHHLSDKYTSYELRTQGTKRLIYSKSLVEQITNFYGLDFSERTSITFYESTYQKLEGNIVAIIAVI